MLLTLLRNSVAVAAKSRFCCNARGAAAGIAAVNPFNIALLPLSSFTAGPKKAAFEISPDLRRLTKEPQSPLRPPPLWGVLHVVAGAGAGAAAAALALVLAALAAALAAFALVLATLALATPGKGKPASFKSRTLKQAFRNSEAS